MSDSIQALREELQDPHKVEVWAACISIGSLLGGCVIAKHYRVPDHLVSPIRLSDLGHQVVAAVQQSNKRMKPNEIKLAAFLNVGCPEGLLISSATDIDALRRGMTAEMQSQKILYAYIYGRDLHDAAAKAYPEKTNLNNLETLSLLKQLPQGVFQEGSTVVGPFGAISSDAHRDIPSRVTVPGYYCSDETCNRIHSIDLSTGESAILRANRAVSDYVDKHHGGTEDEHARVIGNQTTLLFEPASRMPSEGLFDVLADAFTEVDLRFIAENALRTSFRNPDERSRISKRFDTIITSPANFVGTLNRACLLQILMSFTNEAVIAAADSAVREAQIELAEYEVRIARIRRNASADWFAEVGPLGVRSTSPSAVAERLVGLLRRLYYDSGIFEPADLAYSLDRPDAAADSDLVGDAVRSLLPGQVLDKLVLVTRKAAVEAAEALGVEGSSEQSRERLRESLLWKLGAPSEVLFSELDRMSGYGVELIRASDTGESQEALRGYITNLFTATEEALQRALAFST